jgi:Peptidase family M48
MTSILNGYLNYAVPTDYMLRLIPSLVSFKAEALFLENSSPHLKESLRKIVALEKMRDDIKILEAPLVNTTAQAIGTHFLKHHTLYIFLDPRFYPLDPKACQFTMKHELCHIKYSDSFWITATGLIAAIATLIFAKKNNISPFKSFALQFLISKMASYGYSYFAEIRADNFAIKHSSLDELEAGYNFLKSYSEHIKSKRGTLPAKILLTDDGRHRFVFSHPSFYSRLQKIEAELKRQNHNFTIKPSPFIQKMSNLTF